MDREKDYETIKTNLQTDWIVKATGNMTLAILEGRRVVVRVDMLGQNTLKAGDNGERLCRAINDLTALVNAVNGIRSTLPYESGLSPLPWSIKKSEKRYAICDKTGRTICTRNVLASRYDQLMADFDAIEAIIRSVSDIQEEQMKSKEL